MRSRRIPSRVYAWAVIVVILLVLTIGSFTRGDDVRIGGDFSAFYGAGTTIHEVGWDRLYQPEAQAAAQAPYVASGGWLYFAYPPFVAAPYVALAWLPFEAAYVAHTLFMVLCLAAAAALFVRLTGSSIDIVVVTAVALTFGPILLGVVGGQNIALTLVVVTGVAWLERTGSYGAAGLVGALLLFKPQLGLAMGGAILLLRNARMMLGWLAGAATLWLVGALALGVGWISVWTQHLGWFSDVNAATNRQNFVSLPGLGEAISPGGFGVVAGVVAAALVAGAVAVTWWRRGDDLRGRYAVLAAGAVLIAPQSLFYDAGLSFLAVGLVADRTERPRALIAGAWVLGIGVVLRGVLAVNAVGVITVGAFAVSLLLVRERTWRDETAHME